MSTPFQVYYSNRTECLLEHLKETLYSPQTSVFTRRLIIVPSPAMKAWIMLQLAKDPNIGIAAGFEIMYLDQAIKKMKSLYFNEKTNPEPSHLELALAIEHEIRELIRSCKKANLTLETAVQGNKVMQDWDIWRPLFEYLGFQTATAPIPVSLSRKCERRLTHLCDVLANLFIKYGLYGGNMVQSWENKNVSGWQQKLWLKLFHNSQWIYPHKELQRLKELVPNSTPYDVQIDLFAISYLPSIYHETLLKFSPSANINYFILSPCQTFWSDIITDRESHRLQKYWKKQGISQPQQLALEEYLRDCNPLLANFGRIGREMAQQIEESNALTSESYVLTENVKSYDQYNEYLTDDVLLESAEQPLNLLQGIQADMALLRTPNSLNKISCVDDDRSIQIHIASTKMREIQILYDSLLALIDKHHSDTAPISPEDIVVMLPDINSYVPYIKAVFNGPESVLSAQIMDLQIPATNLLIQGFLHLLAIPLGRWDVGTILRLIEFPHFQKRHQLKHDDILQIQKWIHAGGIRWGEDLSHRNELLNRDHSQSDKWLQDFEPNTTDFNMTDSSPIGTWEYAIERLLVGLSISMTNEEAAATHASHIPLGNLDATKGELLGSWIAIMRSLRQDLKCLHDTTEYTLSNWINYLTSLCEAYFIDITDKESEEDYQDFKTHLSTLLQASQTVGDIVLPFTSIKHHLQSLLNQQTASYRENALHAVRFCALLPMRAIPAKIIAMVGMHFGEFPRQEPNSSLNLMVGHPDCEYNPSRIDYDRFLFLEAILSARQYLLITYQGYSTGDGKLQPPSLVVTELLNYLDKSFDLDGQKPSNSCVYKHPFIAFDKSYFNGTFNSSYSKNNFSKAKAHYQQEKNHSECFISDFSSKPLDITDIAISIDLKDLISLARNPMKSYFNKTLGMYLPKSEDKKIKNDEDFLFSSLQNYILKKNALKLPLEHLLHVADRTGEIPVGPFKPIAIENIKNDIASIKKNLKQLGVDETQIFNINLSDQYTVPTHTEEGHWQLPPLIVSKFNNKVIKITGEIANVTPQGLIADIKDNKVDVIKIWPQFLVLCCLINLHFLPIERKLLFVKGDKGRAREAFFEDPVLSLKHYLEYYLTSLEHASPLIPEWIPHLVSQNAEKFGEHMQKSLTDVFQPLYNEYANWALQGQALPNSDLLILNWQNRAKLLYGDVYRHWYPSRAKQTSIAAEDRNE